MPDERTPAAPETMHEAAWRWLLTCPYIEELFLGFATAREGGTVLVPLTACMDSAEREFVDGSSTVSYTHLDVYKRQALRRGAAPMGARRHTRRGRGGGGEGGQGGGTCGKIEVENRKRPEVCLHGGQER